MGMPGGMELLIIFIIVVLIFGGKKIPELMKGIGSGIKNFKQAVKDGEEEKPELTTSNKVEEKSASAEPTKQQQDKKEA
jgi:sec-independent protein translocase protein TatA